MLNGKFFPNTTLPLIVEAPDDARALGSLCSFVELNRGPVFDALCKYGAILFRGYELYDGSSDLQSFAETVAPSLLDYKGGDSPREKVAGNVYTSTSFPAEYRISMHQELSYSRRYPRLIMFYCHTPASTGGETPLLDARQLYRMLPQDLVRKFESKKLKYVQNLPPGPGLGKSWQETFEESDPRIVESRLREMGVSYRWMEGQNLRIEEIVEPVITHYKTGEKVFFSQADQWHSSSLSPDVRESLLQLVSEDSLYHNCFYGDGDQLQPGDLDLIRNLHDKLMVKFRWQKGDLVLVDNILVMHGRMPFTGERKILVAMA